MKVRFKKLNDSAVMPTKAHPTDAGFDLVATSCDSHQDIITYGTGIAVEIPKNHVGLIFPRSSICKKDLILSNCVGVIDSSYRGEIIFKYRRVFPNLFQYKEGERVGQLIILPYPEIEFEEAEDLSDSDRSVGGFGSTGE